MLLIPESTYQPGGPANGRAIAYLAHELIGNRFGSLYDVSTILVLWLAGASAMTGLLNLIPRYLPRFGMAPPWVAYRRPLVLLLLAIDIIVTWIFHANVDRQGSAYATGVLVLMLSAAVAALLWAMSVMAVGSTVRIVSAPVEFSDVPRELRVVDQSAPRITLQLRGSAWLINIGDLSRLVVHFSLRNAQEGVQHFRIGADNLDLPPGIVLDAASPPDLSVRLLHGPNQK